MSTTRLRTDFTSFLGRVRQFFRRNPGAIPIVGFQILLLASAGLLIASLSDLAEGVAVAAYFTLLAGVVLQLVFSVRSHNGQ